MLQVSNLEFEDSNLLRKYPISEEATCVDDDGKQLESDILQDLSIVSYVEISNARIGSIYISNNIVSVTVLDDSGVVAVFTSTVDEAKDELLPSYARPGVFARIRVAACVGETKTYRFSTKEQSLVHEMCILDVRSTRVDSFVDDKSGEEFRGEVSLVFRPGIKCSVKNGNTDDPTVILSADDGMDKTLSTGCVPTNLNRSCVAPVIQSIDGVKPNEFGEIAIVFE
jgi:hypothetical protein